MIRRRRSRHPQTVTVVSMADIAFNLLIFLMLTQAASRGPQIEVQLPEAGTGEQAVRLDAVRLGIDRQGGYSVDGRPVAPDRLTDALRPALAALKLPVVVVEADQGVEWQRVVYGMDLCRGLGVTQLELSVREPHDGTP